MKVVFGADALLRPLSGIGIYSAELARALNKTHAIKDLRFFAHGLFLHENLITSDVIDPPGQHLGEERRRSFPKHLRALSTVRKGLSSAAFAPYLYRAVMPIIERIQLSGLDDYIFHSPNYILPRFGGISVVTFHDLSIQRFPQFHPIPRVKLLQKQMELSITRADHIITDTEMVREEVVAYYGLPAAKVTAIPLAASPGYKPRAGEACRNVLDKFNLEYKSFFLFVSTIEPRKNILRICEAYSDLRKTTNITYPIIFVGDEGWSSEAEHHQIRELESRGWARYLRFVDFPTLQVLYSSARALVFPSIYEGFGLPALEAQQSGTTVVTSLGSAMAEFVSDSDVLVDPFDVSDIKRAMQVIAETDENCLQERGTLPADELSWAKTANATIGVYSALSN